MELLNDEKLFNLVNDISLQYFLKPFEHRVEFNRRLRTTGGRYIPTKKVIELNPKYAAEMADEFIGIIKHELCHYHLHIEGKGYKHGDREFKNLLIATNSPRHCKPLLTNRKEYKYVYTCKRCKYTYRRMRRVNVEKYNCGKCRGKIVAS